MDSRPQGREDGGWICRRTHEHRHAHRIPYGKIRQESLVGDLIAEVHVLDVFHHSDNLHVRLGARVDSVAEMPPQSTLALEIPLYKRFIDDNLGRHPVIRFPVEYLLRILTRKVASLDNRHAQRREVTW